MDFHIPFDVPLISEKLKLKDHIVSIGSCFSDHIASRLAQYKLSVFKHPFGTLYHPLAITNALLPKTEVDLKNDLISKDGVCFHWDAHSQLWGNSPEELIAKYNRATDEISQHIKKADWLIVTLGTAFIYKFEHNRPVANCHKIPQNQFDKVLSPVDEIVNTLHLLHAELQKHNPKIKILYTVSPVRHLRDGLRENHISKAILLQAIQVLQKNENVFYFPSYEIVMDQLRDYRFYENDGAHPNETAINYIWQKLIDAWCSKELRSFIQQWSPILSALQHKALYPKSEGHKKFVNTMISKLENLSSTIDVSQEIAHFKSQIE